MNLEAQAAVTGSASLRPAPDVAQVVCLCHILQKKGKRIPGQQQRVTPTHLYVKEEPTQHNVMHYHLCLAARV